MEDKEIINMLKEALKRIAEAYCLDYAQGFAREALEKLKKKS